MSTPALGAIRRERGLPPVRSAPTPGQEQVVAGDNIPLHVVDATPTAAESPVVVTVADVEPQWVRWLWYGRLPRGKLTVLDGDPSLGKSTLMLDLAARVSTGSPMPDGERLERPESILLMSAEDGIDDTIRPRLDAAGADLARVHVFTEVEFMPGETRLPSLPADLDHLEALIVKHDAAMVVVDVLNAFLSSKVDSYRDQDVRGALHPLAKLAERTSASVVALRHLSKSGGPNALYRGGGSIGIIGAARVGMLVAPDPEDDTRRVLAVSKCNLAAKAPSLAYRLVGSDEHGAARVQWEGTTDHTADGLLVTRDDDSDGTPRADAVAFLEDLLANGAMPAKEVKRWAGDAGIAPRTLDRAKKDLGVLAERVGTLGAGGRWEWRLPPKCAIEPLTTPPNSTASLDSSGALSDREPR